MPAHQVPRGHDRSGFVLQRWGNTLDETEQTLATRCDMSAVLSVVRGPVALGRCVVPFVEESVKGLQNECFVLFLFSLPHCSFLSGNTVPRSPKCSAISSTRSE